MKRQVSRPPGRAQRLPRIVRMGMVVVTFGIILPAGAAQLQSVLSVSAIVTARCALTVIAPSQGNQVPRVQSRCSHTQPVTVQSGQESGSPPPQIGRDVAQGIPMTVVIY